jgi:hypothetical protein
MPNNSSTGGTLSPAPSPAPLEDDALDDFMGDQIAAITGLDRNAAVLRRFQQEPPNLPAAGTDWVAFGVGDSDQDFTAAVIHTSTQGQGVDTLGRNEVLDLVCSFYGPNARANAGLLADGLQIGHNREPFMLAGMSIVDTGRPQRAPQLLKNIWFNRIDLTIRVSRWIVRQYAVLDVASATATITDADDIQVRDVRVLGAQLDFSNPDQLVLGPSAA